MTFTFSDFMNGVSEAQQASTAVLGIPLSATLTQQITSAGMGSVSTVLTVRGKGVGSATNSIMGGAFGALTSNPMVLVAGAVVLILILK